MLNIRSKFLRPIKTNFVWWFINLAVPTLLTSALFTPFLGFLLILGAEPKPTGWFMIIMAAGLLWVLMYIIWTPVQYILTLVIQGSKRPETDKPPLTGDFTDRVK